MTLAQKNGLSLFYVVVGALGFVMAMHHSRWGIALSFASAICAVSLALKPVSD